MFLTERVAINQLLLIMFPLFVSVTTWQKFFDLAKNGMIIWTLSSQSTLFLILYPFIGEIACGSPLIVSLNGKLFDTRLPSVQFSVRSQPRILTLSRIVLTRKSKSLHKLDLYSDIVVSILSLNYFIIYNS